MRAVVDGRPVYAVPRDGGRLVVGATQYETGFDPDVLVGGVRDLLARRRAGPAGRRGVRARGDRRRRCVRAADDNLPLLGPVGPAGLFAATGHGRNGMLLAPVTVDACGALLRGDPARAGRVADPRRLAGRSAMT